MDSGHRLLSVNVLLPCTSLSASTAAGRVPKPQTQPQVGPPTPPPKVSANSTIMLPVNGAALRCLGTCRLAHTVMTHHHWSNFHPSHQHQHANSTAATDALVGISSQKPAGSFCCPGMQANTTLQPHVPVCPACSSRLATEATPWQRMPPAAYRNTSVGCHSWQTQVWWAA